MNLKERISKKIKDDRGAIMLEAMIVYGITLFLLFMILAIFSVLYQRWNLQTIANETAARVAQTYRFSNIDESSGGVSRDDILKVGPYRYFTNGITKKMEKNAMARVSEYSFWRLGRTTFTTDVTEPQCETKVKSDAMGRRHIETTLTGEYAVPFGEVLDYFGLGGTIEYKVSAYADCVDIVDYISFVDFMKKQTSLDMFDSESIKLVDSFISLFENIFIKEENEE